tara:strand:+ start:299 stop:520 length:222 start_codon:yes stop_codon:yes gene_type:complete
MIKPVVIGHVMLMKDGKIDSVLHPGAVVFGIGVYLIHHVVQMTGLLVLIVVHVIQQETTTVEIKFLDVIGLQQ